MRKISKCLSIVLVFLLTLIIMAPMKMQASAHFEESSDHTFVDIETNQKFTNIKTINIVLQNFACHQFSPYKNFCH